MSGGLYAVEVLSSFLKVWNLCSVDLQSLFGASITSWNEIFDTSNSVSIPAGFLVEGRLKGRDKILKFVNVCSIW